MPPLNSWQIIPVPPPTEPSVTGPPRASERASRTCSGPTCWPFTSFRVPSKVSATTGRHQYSSSSARASSSAAMRASRTTPTLWVLVIATGVESTPAPRIHSRPVISPLPLRLWQPAKTGSSRVRPPRGETTVTPVLTGPSPTTRGPSPRATVECPTRTSPTSVIAFCVPGVRCPTSTPTSRARIFSIFALPLGHLSPRGQAGYIPALLLAEPGRLAGPRVLAHPLRAARGRDRAAHPLI